MKQRNPDTTDEVQHGHHEGGEIRGLQQMMKSRGHQTPAYRADKAPFSFERGAKCSAGTGGILAMPAKFNMQFWQFLGVTSGDEPAGVYNTAGK